MKILILRGHIDINTTYFIWIIKKTWACDHLKTRNLSADNCKKYSTSMGRHLSPQCGQVILVSGYPVLTAVNWSQHWWAISFPLGSQTSQKVWENIGCPVVWTVGRAYGHVITKFSRMGRLPHFLRKARAWSPTKKKCSTWTKVIYFIKINFGDSTAIQCTMCHEPDYTGFEIFTVIIWY